MNSQTWNTCTDAEDGERGGNEQKILQIITNTRRDHPPGNVHVKCVGHRFIVSWCGAIFIYFLLWSLDFQVKTTSNRVNTIGLPLIRPESLQVTKNVERKIVIYIQTSDVSAAASTNGKSVDHECSRHLKIIMMPRIEVVSHANQRWRVGEPCGYKYNDRKPWKYFITAHSNAVLMTFSLASGLISLALAWEARSVSSTKNSIWCDCFTLITEHLQCADWKSPSFASRAIAQSTAH